MEAFSRERFVAVHAAVNACDDLAKERGEPFINLAYIETALVAAFSAVKKEHQTHDE